jgi:hypothetical protein
VTDELSEITSEDKEKLKSSLNDIVSETPKTEVAGLRYNLKVANESRFLFNIHMLPDLPFTHVKNYF